MSSELPGHPNNERDVATREIEANLKRLARVKKRANVSSYLWIGLTFSALLSYFLLDEPHWQIFSNYIIISFPMLSMVIEPLCWREYEKAVKRLGTLNDIHAIGILLDAISLDPVSLERCGKTPLIHLLLQLQASQGHLLTQSHRRKLYAMFPQGKLMRSIFHDKNLTLAILRALEQVGDKEAIPHVERVIRTSKEKEVRKAASECLVFLRQRAGQQSISGTLLRPSDAEHAAPDTLLRASVARPNEQPELLLRAHAAPNEQNP